MSLQYYRFFPGDYARDTRHLSMMQNGAYRLLIDEYMVHGPLPNDLQRLYRTCSAFSVEERAAVEYVLTEFFALDGPYWYHKRCEKEREWQASKSESAREAIAVRWKNERDTNVLPTKYERNTNQNQNQNQITTTTKSKPLAQSASALRAVGSGEKHIEIPSLQGDIAILETAVEEWEKLFPAVDVQQTLREIRAWCLANPTRRKTAKGVPRFVTAWFTKEQNRG